MKGFKGTIIITCLFFIFFISGCNAIFTVKFESFDVTIDTKEVEQNQLVIKPVDPVKDGYIFVAWYKDKERTIEWKFNEDKVTENITLYAEWTINEYIVKFDTDNSSEISDQIVTYGSLIEKPVNPVKDGHTFVAWYKDKEKTIEWNFIEDEVTESVILYAGWNKIFYPVTVYNDDVSVYSNYLEYGSILDINLINFGNDKLLNLYTDANLTQPWDCSMPISSSIVLYADVVPVIIDVANGYSFTIILTKDGKVYSFGQNTNGQMGVGNAEMLYSATPMLVPLPAGVRIIKVAAGTAHTALLSEDGNVYTFGYNLFNRLGRSGQQNIPNLIDFPTDTKIVDIAVGNRHTLILTENGKVYGFGENTGYINRAITDYSALLPVGTNIIKIASGYDHSVLIADNGNVYSFGSNQYGQLGTGDQQERMVPTLILTKEQLNIVSISCGYEHTLLLSQDGKVYVLGRNGYGELGIFGLEMALTPQLINLSTEETVISIAAGIEYSILAMSDNKVYVFGKNEKGNLGDGTKINIRTPKLLEIPGLQNVSKVAANCLHTTIIIENGDIYIFGANSFGQLGDGTFIENIQPTLFKWK